MRGDLSKFVCVCGGGGDPPMPLPRINPTLIEIRATNLMLQAKRIKIGEECSI